MNFTQILAESRRIVGADDLQYPSEEIATSVNKALDRVVSLIRKSEGRWEWDDANFTDFPIATASLVADQQDYQLDPTFYKFERIEILDESGVGWHLLKPIDKADLYDQSITDFLKTAGAPQYYDKIGQSIFLYPKPSYSLASAMKVFYERGPSYFEDDGSDTTKSPGINTLFHNLLPMWAAYDFALIKGSSIADRLRNEIAIMESELADFYALRAKDDHIRVVARRGYFK